MQLFKASGQWATRPADERFWGPEDALAATRGYFADAAVSEVSYGDLRVDARGPDIALIGKENVPATLTNYAFGQLAQRVKAPADYLRRLPPTLAAQNLNHGLKVRAGDDSDKAKLLLHRNGGYLARCLTGTGYQRIWNWQVFDKLVALVDQGWRVPPARPAVADPRARKATAEDVGWCGDTGLSIKEGDTIAPAGIYASDRDMFAFLVHPDRHLLNPLDTGTPLMRGFFCWNSEVGDRSFGVMSFLLDAVCGNHIVWGARDVKEVRVRHVGTAHAKAFGQLRATLRAYADESASDDEARIRAAQELELGTDMEDTVDALLKWAGRKPSIKGLLSRQVLEQAWDIADRTPRYGNPNTPWAVAQGITEISQGRAHTNVRTRLDEAAGRVISMAF